MKISAVINTYNEEKNLERCLNSVKDFAGEIVVVDMHSNDKTLDIAKKHKAKIFDYEYTRYVEPARNFALKQAKGDWILLLDADEELPLGLSLKLKEIAEENQVDFVEIPRKNIVFGKWVQHSRWWPDFLIRFFKNGKVKFSDKIHIPPVTEGKGTRLDASDDLAIVHYNYNSISQYIERLDRYSDIQSRELEEKGYKFKWSDLITKPSNEFFSRFFFGEGYKDGVHGLALSLLQSFSELTVYLKGWEAEGFKEEDVKGADKLFQRSTSDLFYWLQKTAKSPLAKIRLKIKSKV